MDDNKKRTITEETLKKTVQQEKITYILFEKKWTQY